MADTERVERLLAEFPGLSTEELSLDDLPFIRMATANVCSHWYNVGIYYHLSTDFLDGVRSKYRQNVDRCLTAVLAEWIKNATSVDVPSWRSVVAVVASRVGGDNPAEARKIARIYTNYGRETNFKDLDKVDDRHLSPDDLSSVKEAVMEGVADKWFSIGLLLGIPYFRLEGFEAEDTLSNRVTMMLTEWLGKRYETDKFGVPCWRRLVEVIAAKSGGSHNYLARQLAKKHPVGAPQPQEQLYPSSSLSGDTSGPPKPADALTEANLAVLMKILRPIASQWEFMGVQLGLPPGEISLIRGKPLLLSGAPLSFMQEMLYVWLQSKPPNAWPTVRVLCDCLGDMDENDLVRQVKAKF